MAASGPIDNTGKVLQAVRDLGPASVAELASETGLSRPTVDQIVSRLEDDGLITTEVAKQRGRSGRPARISTLRADGGAVIGIDLTGDEIYVVVADLAGRVLGVGGAGVLAPSGRNDDLASVVDAVTATLARLGLHRDDVRGIGIGVAGLVAPNGQLLTAPQVPSWQGRNLSEAFAAVLGAPVVVDNDLSLAAAAEAQSPSMAGIATGVFALTWFHVSARLVIDGRVVRGRTGSAGEVGLLAAIGDIKGPAGTLREAMPVAMASLRRLRAGSGTEADRAMVSDLADSMAPAISAMALAVDPERIVLGGELSEFCDLIAPSLAAAITKSVSLGSVDAEIVPSHLGKHAVALGALSRAFSTFSTEIYGSPNMSSPTLPDRTTIEKLSAGTAPDFKAALIGAGARAGLARHIRDAGGEIIAVADPDARARQTVDKFFGPETPIYPSTAELLSAHPDLDGAIVAAPDNTHAEIAIELLRAGVPVYLEKPLAISTEDCDRVLQTAYETNVKLYVGHNMRHMHVVRLMKEIIDRGEIGEVKAIWCRHFVGTGGDFYFKDWHADRSRSGSLLLQKGAHDIDVMQWLAGSSARLVTGIGDLAIYGGITDRRDNSDRIMWDWFSNDNWPPLTQTELNPVIDVEDISMIMGRLDSGALISYQQCHFAPDYWRNYTVIGTEGRLENFGDGEGGEVRVWNKRSGFLEKGHVQYPIVGDANGHGDADKLTVAEFVEFVRHGTPTDTSPVSARDAVATGIAGAESIRNGSRPVEVPRVPGELLDYFAAFQPERSDRAAGGGDI